MSSGVSVADRVMDIYNEMRLVKGDSERIRLVVLVIKEGVIDVEDGKIFREKDLQDKDVYGFFLSLMKDDECRFLLYDCHFTTELSPKDELVFAMWAPDTANIGLRMKYASSKKNLVKSLTGVKHDLQINSNSDYSDVEDFAKKIGGADVVSVEGRDCKHH